MTMVRNMNSRDLRKSLPRTSGSKTGNRECPEVVHNYFNPDPEVFRMLRKRTGGIDGAHDRLTEMNLVARDWWSCADTRLLPGETGAVTVFVIDFADGCRFFGYTRSRVFDRVSVLVAKRGAYVANEFVSDHAVRVPYVVRCVASGLGRGDARELRDFLVLLGPSRSAGTGRSVVESACCWLSESDGCFWKRRAVF